MRQLRCDGDLTLDGVKYINSLNDKVYLTLDNTKGLRSEIVGKLNSDVVISVLGGLNPKKKKYNNHFYQERTYYSPKELSMIIKKFEHIERTIRPNWTELEKAMYIYKILCEEMIYSECQYGGRDSARNLLGMITGKSVCAGFAMIYKEALDRINIFCEYQNKEGQHSWNIIKTDGEYHAVELTWDTCNKIDNECRFAFFCREDMMDFYNQGGENYHDIDDEKDEVHYPAIVVPINKLQEAYNKITVPYVFDFEINGERLKNCKIDFLKPIRIHKNTLYIPDRQEFTFFREDGTTFMLIPLQKAKEPLNINEFMYIEKRDDKFCKGTMIYSENDLIDTKGYQRENVANELLSKERLQNKILNYNGYVGYLINNQKTKFYNKDVEQSLNIKR